MSRKYVDLLSSFRHKILRDAMIISCLTIFHLSPYNPQLKGTCRRP